MLSVVNTVNVSCQFVLAKKSLGKLCSFKLFSFHINTKIAGVRDKKKSNEDHDILSSTFSFNLGKNQKSTRNKFSKNKTLSAFFQIYKQHL